MSTSFYFIIQLKTDQGPFWFSGNLGKTFVIGLWLSAFELKCQSNQNIFFLPKEKKEAHEITQARNFGLTSMHEINI